MSEEKKDYLESDNIIVEDANFNNDNLSDGEDFEIAGEDLANLSDGESIATNLTFMNPSQFAATGVNTSSNQANLSAVERLRIMQSNELLQAKNLSEEEKKRQTELLKVYKLKKMAKSIKIPVNDKEVKLNLRELGQPICYFGEKAVDRKERLKKIMINKLMTEGKLPQFSKKLDPKEENKVAENEIFYTEGNVDLKQVRMQIAKYSIPKSAYRLAITKKKFMEIDRIQESLDYEKFLQNMRYFEFKSSEYADDRGCARGRISPNNELYGVAGWSSTCTVFSLPDLSLKFRLVGHTDRVNYISFHPQSLSQIPKIGPNIATASSDNTVKIWTCNDDWEEQKCVTFKGHEDRVNYVEFHPMGRVIASTSHDKTWRLWDIETKKELMYQEGHSNSVYPLSFQDDGALLSTGDLNGIGLIWDLRSGKNIMSLQGHVKQIISMKFSSNCYQLATGSDDNTVKIWDLRRKGCKYTLPAHKKTISDICFDKNDSQFMFTCSYDASFKLWNVRDWSIVKSFTSPGEGKLTSLSITKDSKYILTTSLDRTVKMWENIGPNESNVEEEDKLKDVSEGNDIQMS